MRAIPAVAATVLVAVCSAACSGGCGDPGGATSGGGEDPFGHTRVLELAVEPPAEGGLTVENLAGSFTVVRGEGEKILVRATVRAGSEELAGELSLERVADPKDGGVVVRVAYPLDETTSFRYGTSRSTGSAWLDLVGGGRSTWGGEYAGRRVRVSDGSGTPLYADVEVRVPGDGNTARLSTLVGDMVARGVSGELSFSTVDGTLSLETVSGVLEAQTLSGDLEISSLDGSLACSTARGSLVVKGFTGGKLSCNSASGDMTIEDSAGELLKLTTASGEIALKGVSTSAVRLSTASGDIRSEDGGMDEFHASTASGSVDFRSPSLELKDIDIGTAGGDIALFLSDELPFEIRTGGTRDSRLDNRMPGSEPIMEDDRIVGYRRGAGGAAIDISSGHGSVSLAPLPTSTGG